MSQTPIANLPKVLVVEDEPLVAMMLEDMLADAGCQVVATAPNLSAGLTHAENSSIDLAILDMTLGADSSFPLADVLAERGVPFLFASGYGSAALPPEHRHRVVLGKPYSYEDLVKKLKQTLSAA